MASAHRLTRSSKIAKPFRFLDLPAELRNTILQLAFATSSTSIASETTPGTHACIYHFVHETSSPRTTRSGLPAILQANKQMRKEGAGIFYSHTTWTAKDDYQHESQLHLLRKLGAERRSLVTGLCLRQQSGSETSQRLAEELEQFIPWVETQLEQLGLVCEHAVLSVEIDGPGWRFCWP